MKLLIYRPDQPDREPETSYKMPAKHRVVVSGVYKIECTYTNSVYVGQSTNMKTRLKNHESQLRLGRHVVDKMQSDYNLYSQYFIFEEIDRIDDQCLLKWETFYISQHKEEGFNIYNTVYDTANNSVVNCPEQYTKLINKLIEGLNKGKIRAEDIERGLLSADMY